MKKSFLISVLSVLLFLSLGLIVVSAQGNPPTGGGNPVTGGGNPVTGGGNSSTGGGNPVTGGANPSSGGLIDNPFNCGSVNPCTLVTLLEAIINNILMPIGGVIAILAFIYVGFKFVMAQGNTSKIEEAKRALLYVAIGTAVLLGAWVIANVIGNTIHQFQSAP